MKKKRQVIGIIGAGMIAQDHIENLSILGKGMVKWIADINPDLGKEIADKFNVQNCTTNYAEILADDEVTAVIIATPPFTHLEIFRRCVRAGKNILIEKPICINKEELEEFERLIESKSHLIIMDASGRHSRLQPKFKKIKSIIDSGVLGDIYYIHHNSVARQFRPGIEYHPSAKWFLDKNKSGGGPILDWGVYDLSFHLGILSDRPNLLGASAFLKNRLDNKDPETDIYTIEEHGAALMKFDNGLEYFWERGAHANVGVPGETRIYGTRGGLKFSYITWEPEEIIHYYLDKDEKSKEKQLRVNMKHHKSDNHALMKHFINVLNGKEEPVIPLSVSIKHLNIIFDLYAAASTDNNTSKQ